MPFLHSLSQWRCRRPLVGLSSLKRSIAMTSTTASGHVDGTTSLSSISPSQSRSSKPFTIGILRETYDQWERRAPLTPEQCRDFLQQQQCGGHGNDNSNVVQRRIIVQPSSRRIFSDQQYIDAGAFVQESLHDADLVLGVKRPHPTIDIQDLFKDQQTSMFFSHVIKGQPDNMKLLQDLLDRHVQLIDYEKITVPADGNKDRRLVAFGKYAGLAGMIDTLSIVGQRLLRSHSLSTPFLNCPPSIYHASLDDAKAAVKRVGERIAVDGITIPKLVTSNKNEDSQNEPLVFCLTGGPRGNVYSGVREIFDLLPNEVVAVEDLPSLHEQITKDPSSACQHKIYGVVPEMKDIFKPIGTWSYDDGKNDDCFDRSHFVQHPDMYRSTFAENIAPYIHVLVNGIYWEHRFPRLLSKNDMYQLYHKFRNERLMVVSDISCDIQGSIEFLERSTSIDKPCYQYDPIVGHESTDSIGVFGVTVFGVDILPSELPVESSRHFGTALEQVLPQFVNARHSTGKKQDGTDQVSTIDPSKLSLAVSRALITTKDGTLADDYTYLAPIMEHALKRTSEDYGQSMDLSLDGHLFDSNLINHVLDLLERNDCDFAFKECNVQYRPKGEAPIKSNVVLKISGDDSVNMTLVRDKIQNLVDAMVAAEATVRWMDLSRNDGGETKHLAFVESEGSGKTVVLLGSGRVSMSVVDWFGRNTGHHVTVASNNDAEGSAVASLAKNGKADHVSMDILNDKHGLAKLVERSDLVISLLPATMHPKVAQLCIDARKDLVTASYESKEMLELRDRAEASGIRILNEIGLDPGLDHCSAMKIIDDIRDRGGCVTTFESVCGGLPAPEAANNPLRYKFSWSPRGVISASQNDARYLRDGRLISVRGNELLANATPFTDSFTDLDLECLPNRDSLNYQRTYGIDKARTIFRGTLRYSGFSSLMHVFRSIGLLDTHTLIDGLRTWDDVVTALSRNRGGFTSVDDFFLACCGEDDALTQRTAEALAWLGIHGKCAHEAIQKKLNDRTIVDLFCDRLEERLKFGPAERDMVVMHHKIGAEFDNGAVEEHHSSLQVFGTESTMTAMCRTVGFPVAAAADLILRGDLDDCAPGLLLPTSRAMYIPILDAVKKEGINFEEHCLYGSSCVTEQKVM